MPPKTYWIGLFWLLLLLVTGLSLYPFPPGGEVAGSDKVLHLLAYLVLFVSLDLACCFRQRPAAKIIGLLAYSFLLEMAQLLVPSRHFSLADLVANLAGLLLGLLIAAPLGRFLKARGQLS